MSLIVDIRKGLGPTSLHACFTVAAGESLALLGPSGSGKSVTLKCIAGILRPDEGHIELDGAVLFDSAGHIDLPPQKRRVGYLFQQYALFPHMTVEQNIAAALPDRARREKELPELLRRFRLEGVARQKPRTLSGGEQQRAALARLLASHPRCILLDEPLSALDAPLRAQLELELQLALEDFSGPMVWVTHDRGEAWRNCREVCVIHHGRTRPPRAKEDLFRAPRDLVEAQMGGVENVFEGVKTSNSVQLPQLGLTLPLPPVPSSAPPAPGAGQSEFEIISDKSQGFSHISGYFQPLSDPFCAVAPQSSSSPQDLSGKSLEKSGEIGGISADSGAKSSVFVAFRAAALRPAASGEGSFPCEIIRIIDDLDGISVLLRPKSSEKSSPPLRMKLPHSPPISAVLTPQPLVPQGFAPSDGQSGRLAPADAGTPPSTAPSSSALSAPQPLVPQGFSVGQELRVALAGEDIFLFEKGDISL